MDMSIRQSGAEEDVKAVIYQSGEIVGGDNTESISPGEDRYIVGYHTFLELNITNAVDQTGHMNVYLSNSEYAGRTGPSIWDNENFLFRHSAGHDTGEGIAFGDYSREIWIPQEDWILWEENVPLTFHAQETQGNEAITLVAIIYYVEIGQ